MAVPVQKEKRGSSRRVSLQPAERDQRKLLYERSRESGVIESEEAEAENPPSLLASSR